MAQLNAQAQAQWEKYMSFYVKALSTPEHINAVQNFMEAYMHDGLVSERGQKTLHELLISISKTFNVKIGQVVLSNNDKINGGYTPQIKGLFLNTAKQSFPSFLMTIYHEMRHAWQFQVLKYQNDEFAEAMKQDAANYRVFDETVIGKMDYFTNLLEEDAVLFAVNASENVLMRLPINSDLKNSYIRELDKLQQIKMGQIITYEKVKKDSIENTNAYIKEYGEVLISIFKSTEPPAEKKKKIDQKLSDLQFKISLEQLVRTDKTFVHGVLKYIFDNCTVEELARNIDDPNVSILKRMENKYNVKSGSTYSDSILRGTYFGSRFEQLQDYVHKAKDMLEKHKIPYDKNDDGRMFTTFLDLSPELYAEAFARKARGRQQISDKDLTSLITTMKLYGLIDSQKIRQKIIEKYGMRKISSWFKMQFNAEKDPVSKPFLSVNAVSILGYRLGDFERESQQMSNSQAPKRAMWKTIFGRGQEEEASRVAIG